MNKKAFNKFIAQTVLSHNLEYQICKLFHNGDIRIVYDKYEYIPFSLDVSLNLKKLKTKKFPWELIFEIDKNRRRKIR